MLDYLKRFLIAAILALCVSLLFLGGRHTEASMLKASEAKVDWIWPADGVISDTYGTRLGKHKGIDIAGKLGSPVLAVDDGVVVKSYYSNTYGNVVFINHLNQYVTVYAHLNKRFVSEGQTIKQGKMLGGMGSTGQATGVHLHFETHETAWTYDKKNAFDPERLLGKAEVGEAVQGGIASSGDNIVAASSDYRQELRANVDQYIVKKGDTLASIARKKNLSIEKIKHMNRLKSDLIMPKQILFVPE
ncbi:peptidase M23 [Bacillus sp. MUM 116]|uniref:peptidoglycan DD-metalloendopeptidase family protein n=1 Tax=Bacillus sp. MUM 116 TaxID=1678002 RepID=UPI0008F5CBE5|nr:peptidoglycan DD-metalloendopeptidase family protein [Bacillus sp. MUM 116]OIK15536.1 peptidase M23 [Bacillus sp. MUM 116]